MSNSRLLYNFVFIKV